MNWFERFLESIIIWLIIYDVSQMLDRDENDLTELEKSTRLEF